MEYEIWLELVICKLKIKKKIIKLSYLLCALNAAGHGSKSITGFVLGGGEELPRVLQVSSCCSGLKVVVKFWMGGVQLCSVLLLPPVGLEMACWWLLFSPPPSLCPFLACELLEIWSSVLSV